MPLTSPEADRAVAFVKKAIQKALQGAPKIRSPIMPGPVSDSFDPEYGTSSNKQDVREALEVVRDKIGKPLGPALKNIVSVVHGKKWELHQFRFTEQELRVMRFGLNKALEFL